MKISIFLSHLKAIHRLCGKSYEEIARLCREIGIERVDVEQSELFGDSRSVLDVFLNSGMDISSMITRCDFIHNADTSGIDGIIDTAKEFKIKRIFLVVGMWQEGDDRDECYKRSLEPVKMLVKKAKENGISVGIEDYDADMPTKDTKGLLWYLERVDDLHCIFDTGNFAYALEDTLDAYKSLKFYITEHIHLKDRAVMGLENQNPMLLSDGSKTYACPVGSGIIPIEKILNDQKASGFDGTLTIELFGSCDYLGDTIKSAEWIKERMI